VFDRFTEDSKKTMNFARQESQRWSHEYLGPEHMLLALVTAGENGATQILTSSDVSLPRVRADVERRLSRGGISTSPMPLRFTDTAKKVLEIAMTESTFACHKVIGTGHLLLALTIVPDTVPFAVLGERGVKEDDVRAKLIASGGWDVSTSPTATSAPNALPDSRADVLHNAVVILRAIGQDRIALDVERVANGMRPS
jgi:ATP-dependent Clp protease ATP-binding subunit ClpA